MLPPPLDAGARHGPQIASSAWLRPGVDGRAHDTFILRHIASRHGISPRLKRHALAAAKMGARYFAASAAIISFRMP